MGKIVMDYGQIESICKSLDDVATNVSSAKNDLNNAIRATQTSWPDVNGQHFRTAALNRTNEIEKIFNYYKQVSKEIRAVSDKFKTCESNAKV